MENSKSKLLNTEKINKKSDVDLKNKAEVCSTQLNVESAENSQVGKKMDFANNSQFSLVSQQKFSSSMKQSRSVKEYEEQMSELRKENFNLKLRLYFLEENIPEYQTNAIEGPETLLKQLVDAKVEMESLRSEIQEKQNLLKEAVAAINKMEEERSLSEVRVSELKNRLAILEHDSDLNLVRSSNTFDSEVDFPSQTQIVRELEDRLKISDKKLIDFQDQINKLDDILTQRDNTIEEYESKIKTLISKNNKQLKTIEEMEKQDANTQKILKNVCATNEHLKKDNENLRKTLNTSNDHFTKEVTNVKICEKQMLEQQEALCKMQCEIEMEKLRAEIANKNCLLQQVEEKLKNRCQIHQKACHTIQKLMINIKNQEEELNALKKSKKRNSNVAFAENIDNAEKLPVNRKRANLNKTFSRSLSFSLLDEKKLDDDVKDSLISKLRKDIEKANRENEAAQKIKQECIQMCNTLSNHLEELASFLNLLLKHKDILCIIRAENYDSMRKAVNKSLDLSKKLNESFSDSKVSLMDYSTFLADYINNLSIDTSNEENMTFNSDNNLSTNYLTKTLETSHHQTFNEQSESQIPVQMQEPRNYEELPEVSGCESSCNKSQRAEIQLLENRVFELEQILINRDQYIAHIEKQFTESENCSKEQSSLISKLKLEMEHLRQKNVQLQNAFSDFEMKAENTVKQIELYDNNLNKLIKENENLVFVVEQANGEINELKSEFNNMETKYKKALKDAEEQNKNDLNQLACDFDNKMKNVLQEKDNYFKTDLETNWISRNIYDELQNSYKEAKIALHKVYEDKINLDKMLNESEILENLLPKQITNDALQTSNVNMQRSKSFDDKMLMSKAFDEFQTNQQSNELQFKTSDALHCINQSSDDLDEKENIEVFEDVNIETETSGCKKNVFHDCAKIENENAELRQKLKRNKLALIKTFEKLRVTNKKKTQIEQEIRNQIIKTQNILKNVRSNMEYDV